MSKSHHRRRARREPCLRFSPYAWAKLLYLRDLGDTEIGAFGVTPANELLVVEDIQLVKQRCTPVTVAFDDQAVADFYDLMVDGGLQPERFGRVWIHTHPGDCPLPSSTDEDTFQRVFGRADWSVMAILARNDAAYARLQFRAGPGGSLELPVQVDFSREFSAAVPGQWKVEYLDAVTVELGLLPAASVVWPVPDDWPYSAWDWEEWNDDEFRARSL